MKKILFVIDNLLPGGAEKVLISILNNFDFKKYDVTLLLLTKEGDLINRINKNVNIKYLFDFTDGKIKKIISKVIRKIIFTFASKANFFIYPKWIYKEKYDTYIGFMEGISTKYIAGIKTMSKKIAWVHTDVDKYRWYSKYYKNYYQEIRTYNYMNEIICVSADSLKGFEKRYPEVLTNKKYIYNILDENLIYSKSNEDIKFNEGFNICCIGRLEYEKGFDIVINVFKKLSLRYEDVYLNIIGSGSQESLLQESINKQEINEKVKLYGYKSNPYPYIRKSDVVICSSRNEGFSLVVAEALMLNKLVISTKCSGPIEILENGKFGILIDDENDLLDVLIKVKNDDSIIRYYEEITKEARKKFNSKDIMKQIYEVI